MTVLTVLAEILARVFFKILDKLPGWLTDKVLSRIGKRPVRPELRLYPSTCGDRGIDLAQQRLLVSTAFGTYFAGLLERDHSYVALRGQIVCPGIRGYETLEPIERIFLALREPKGPYILFIAADGGMGKSTLATKIVRCLLEQRDADLILGDSAKTQTVDPVTGAIITEAPPYYDVASFHKRLCSQLGIPYRGKAEGKRHLFRRVRDRIAPRRAVVIIDNLETVQGGGELVRSLSLLTDRDVRAVVTTRKVERVARTSQESMTVNLNPLTNLDIVRRFLEWHIEQYRSGYSSLAEIARDLKQKKLLRKLVDRTGGIPLLIQLVFSEVPRSSWNYIDTLPQLFGDELLDFLYRTRWEELGQLKDDGLLARHILRFVMSEQYAGKKVTFKRLSEWSEEASLPGSVSEALRLLFERFLLVNHDPRRGNYVVFPSLAEFVERKKPEQE